MASRVVVSRAELDRMRNSVKDPVVSAGFISLVWRRGVAGSPLKAAGSTFPPHPHARAQITDYEAARRQKKALSDERQSRWPNTLEVSWLAFSVAPPAPPGCAHRPLYLCQAQRRKKDHWKEEKLAKEEEDRVRIDREEHEMQRSQRIDAIKRANYILYEQTDKMKGLRSAQMYTDVLEDRKEQLTEKVIKAQWTDGAGADYYQAMLREVAELNAKEDAKEARKKAAREHNRVLQQEQLAETRERYMARLRQEKREGELVIEKSKQELVEDAEKAAERKLQARMASEEMTLANQRLKKLQLELSLKEADEDAKRLAELRHKEHMAVARKELDGKRFIEKQAVRQRMIDRAVADLAARATEDDRVAEKQASEARAKEDAELARRDAKRQWQKDAIEESRRQVMERKKALADLEASEAAERFARHTAKVEQMERAEFDKQAAARRRNENTRAAIEQQIAVKAAVREAEREAQLREDAQTRAVLEEDEERFLRVARSVYEEARDDGKNTIPIEKAMFAKSITLMPASTSMRL